MASVSLYSVNTSMQFQNKQAIFVSFSTGLGLCQCEHIVRVSTLVYNVNSIVYIMYNTV